jgi:1-acyl-sn-glycerol-3-phosphate acyltransferase
MLHMGKIVTIIKTFWLFSWAAIMTLLLFIPMSTAALLSRTGNLPFTISKQWAKVILLVTGTRVRIIGREKIAPGSRYVIISNHQSQFDILALVTSIRMQFRWVIKKELLRIPLFGWALYAARNVFIDRGDHEKALASIHRGVDRLPEGVSVLVFAEGTRSPDGLLGKFKKGGFMISVEKGLPILPVAVKGSRDVLPKGSTVFTPGKIEVVVCDPVDPAGFTHDTISALIDKTHGIIDQELRR